MLASFFEDQGLTDDEAKQVEEKFLLKNIPKGDYFVKEGKTSRHLGFVQKGFLQYYVNIDGEEKTTYSAGEHQFVASLVSYLKEVPARENIRAVIDTKLWVIEKADFDILQQNIPSLKKFYTGLLEWQICCIDESRLDSLMLNAQERYLKMLEKEPSLIRQIPLQYLSSILGITPRHLSRIRNNIR
jgi:CRP-like cAMP-binding protein